MANQYKKGKLVRVAVEFTVGGVLTDPGAVTLKIIDPDGTLTTPSMTKDSTGKYHSDVTGSKSGFWNYRTEGTAPCAAVDEGYFEILPSKF